MSTWSARHAGSLATRNVRARRTPCGLAVRPRLDANLVAGYRDGTSHSWGRYAALLSDGDNPLTLDIAAAARKLVTGGSSTHVTANAVQTCEQLSWHLARLIGEIGVRTLLARSAALTSARFPWLAGAIPRTASADSPWAPLSAAMESQDPRTASEGFVDLLSTFIELLGRLIGDALVGRLLHELWPELFLSSAKGTP